NFAKPCLSFPESLLLSENLSLIEKQLLDEWKRFKQVSLNNCDPNFKPNLFTKLFQVRAPTAVNTTPVEFERKTAKVNVEPELENNCQDGQLEESVIKVKRTNNDHANSMPIE